MKKIIIDCDTGMDDAIAIMIAVSSPDVEVLAITCVTGNSPLDMAALNTLRVLTVCNKLQIPIYKGASSSLLERNYERATFVHGENGLGDVPEAYPDVDEGLIKEENAVLLMTRLARQHPGQITLVCLGPLTNVALAMKMDPKFGSNLKEAVFMGGNIEGIGNTSVALCGEFNFVSDSEAAYLVLKSLWCPIKLVSWELCIRSLIDWDKFENGVLGVQTPKGKFLKAITSMSMARLKQKKSPGVSMCDPTALVVALDDSAIVESTNKHCMVELRGEYTRGMVCIDWQGRLGLEPNVEIVTKVDTEKLFTRLRRSVLDEGCLVDI